jgi:MtN3 and saliva related transmembrane protein
MNIEIITGIAASVLTGISALPQLFKIIKEKSVENISLAMFIVLLAGLALWTCYGFMKKDWILFGSSLFSFLVNTSIVILKIKLR